MMDALNDLVETERLFGSVPLAPTVSIIIPTYQRWEFLCVTIESVLQQSFTDWEIVVVNDCGGTPPRRVLELLQNPKIKYFEHTTNKGVSRARNTGIQGSSGEFLMYLDDDDVLYPNHLELLVAGLLNNNWDVAYTDANEGTYDLHGTEYCLVDTKVVFGGEFSQSMMWRANTIPILSVMHRRACLEKTGNFDDGLQVLEDWELWLRFTMHYQFHHIPVVTAEYKVRRDYTNVSQNTSDDRWMKVKCRIYFKFLNDAHVMADNNFRKLLFKTVSWFIVVRIEWFARMMNEPETDQYVIGMLRFVTPMTWVIIFAKKRCRRFAFMITRLLCMRILGSLLSQKRCHDRVKLR